MKQRPILTTTSGMVDPYVGGHMKAHAAYRTMLVSDFYSPRLFKCPAPSSLPLEVRIIQRIPHQKQLRKWALISFRKAFFSCRLTDSVQKLFSCQLQKQTTDAQIIKGGCIVSMLITVFLSNYILSTSNNTIG